MPASEEKERERERETERERERDKDREREREKKTLYSAENYVWPRGESRPDGCCGFRSHF